LLQHTLPASEQVASSIDIADSEGINISGCQIVSARTRGIAIANCRLVRVADCTIRGSAIGFRAALTVDGKCRRIMIVNNYLERGSDSDLEIPANAGTATGNVTLE
jgi:hypothetical protein